MSDQEELDQMKVEDPYKYRLIMLVRTVNDTWSTIEKWNHDHPGQIMPEYEKQTLMLTDKVFIQWPDPNSPPDFAFPYALAIGPGDLTDDFEAAAKASRWEHVGDELTLCVMYACGETDEDFERALDFFRKIASFFKEQPNE